MHTYATPIHIEAAHPVDVHVVPALHDRNRLTVAFRLLLGLPHLVLVGGPTAVAGWWTWHADSGSFEWAAGGGALGVVAALGAIIGWFSIVSGRRYPEGLWDLAAFYLRWRVRAIAYLALLRDEYPPFGDGSYAALMHLPRPRGARDRWSVGFRIVLVLPHLIVLWLLGFAWAVSTALAWLMILFTGNFPVALYRFGVGMLRWNVRVEAYALLLRDEYPPFSLDE